jgi:hypothetical protein
MVWNSISKNEPSPSHTRLEGLSHFDKEVTSIYNLDIELQVGISRLYIFRSTLETWKREDLGSLFNPNLTLTPLTLSFALSLMRHWSFECHLNSTLLQHSVIIFFCL